MPIRTKSSRENLEKIHRQSIHGFGIVNLKDAPMLPNSIVRAMIRKKVKQTGAAIYTDPDRILSKAWDLGDCNGVSSCCCWLPRTAVVQFMKRGEMAQAADRRVLSGDRQIPVVWSGSDISLLLHLFSFGGEAAEARCPALILPHAMINARNLLSAILLLAVTGLPVYGRSSSSVSAAAADTTIGYSSDTVFKASGDTVVKHRYLTRIKERARHGLFAESDLFRRFYHYFESANEDKTLTKKFDFSIICVFTNLSDKTEAGLGLAGSRTVPDRQGGHTLTPPSNVSLFSGALRRPGPIRWGVRGNTLFEQSKYRLDFTGCLFLLVPGSFLGNSGTGTRTENPAESPLQAASEPDKGRFHVPRVEEFRISGSVRASTASKG